MSGLIRTLLVCLLALALPVQGALAATRVFCAAHHPGGTLAGAVLGTAASPADGHAHHHAGLHDGPHAGVAPAAPPEDAAVSMADPAGSGFGSTADGKCSACAACCAPALMPTPARRLPAAEPAPTVFAAVESTVEAFASDGPDRPPRTSLV